MASVQILDCTLRDGGYVNDWGFRDRQIRDIIKNLLLTGIEVIEVGYLNKDKGRKIHSTLFRSINEADSMIPDKGTESAKFVLMLNIGDFPPEEIPCLSPDNKISGIRLAFHKHEAEKAISTGTDLVKKGFQVFMQPMVTASYTDRELLELIERCNQFKPHSFYIVDSFGSIDKATFERMVFLVENNLDKEIRIGFHSHNNMQLAYSNSIEMINLLRKRDIYIDSSIFGMGRGAGNLNTEILASFLNKETGKDYKIDFLLEVIDNHLETMYRTNYWGFSLAQFLSASNNCHPNYASYLINRKTLTIRAIKQILGFLSQEKAVKFDSEHIKQLYTEYLSQNRISEDLSTSIFADKEILLIASGRSVKDNLSMISQYQKSHNAITIGLNNCPEVDHDFVFFSNQRRYEEFKDQIDQEKLIVTSNINTHLKHRKFKTIDYAKHILQEVKNYDNVAIILLNYLRMHKIPRVSIAGLDGYNINSSSDYYSEDIDVIRDESKKREENHLIEESLKVLSKSITIKLITPSIFKRFLPTKIIGIIFINTLSAIDMLKFDEPEIGPLKKIVFVSTDGSGKPSLPENTNLKLLNSEGSEKKFIGRIGEISSEFGEFDYYIAIKAESAKEITNQLRALVKEVAQNRDLYDIYCIAKNISKEELFDNSSVKLVINCKNEVIYATSRTISDFPEPEISPFKKMLPALALSQKALLTFNSNQPSRIERFEKVEIAKFLDLSQKLKIVEA